MGSIIALDSIACLVLGSRALDLARSSPEPLDQNNGKGASSSLAGLTLKETVATLCW